MSSSNSTYQVCIQPSLFPFTGNDAGLGFIVLIVSFLASIGGVGGGGILIPLITLITDMCLERTIPLVVMMVFSNAITRTLVFLKRRYPGISSRYLINYDILLVMLPFSSNFSVFGLLLNVSMPILITTVFLILVMIIMLCIVLNKGILLFKEDRRLLNIRRSDEVQINEIKIDGIQNTTSLTKPQSITVSDTGVVVYVDEDDSLRERRKRWDTEQPKDAITSLILLGIAIGIIGVFAGLRQVFTRCGLEYWLMIGFQMIVIMLYVAFVIMFVYWRIEKRRSVNYPKIPNEPNVTPKLVIILACLGILLGVVGTYIGIGGGIAIGPVLLALGIDIRMVIATNTTAILFTSFVSSIQYISRGLVYWDYAIYCCLLASVGAGLAVIVNDKIEQKWNRMSYLAFVLAFLMSVSTIMLIYNGVTKFDLIPIEFGNLCHR